MRAGGMGIAVEMFTGACVSEGYSVAPSLCLLSWTWWFLAHVAFILFSSCLSAFYKDSSRSLPFTAFFPSYLCCFFLSFTLGHFE